MAIVDNKSDVFDTRDATTNELSVVDPIRSRGFIRCALGSINNLAGDNDTSVYRLWRMPARGILLPLTKVDLQSWGYAAATLGLATPNGATLTEDGLLSSVTVSGLSAPSTPVTHGATDWTKPVWELAGLSADPGEYVDVIIGTAADAAGAGSATFEAYWLID